MINVKVCQQCVDFYMALARFSDVLLYKVSSKEEPKVKRGCFLQDMCKLNKCEVLLRSQHHISEVRWKPFYEGISAVMWLKNLLMLSLMLNAPSPFSCYKL